MSDPNRSVDVSVVSHGQWSMVRELIALLGDRTSSGVGTIVLTINVPEAVDEAFLRSHRVRIVQNCEPRGFACNHNAAFALCDAPNFAVLNPDLSWRHDPFAPLVTRMLERQAAMIAPRIIEDGQVADSARALLTPADLVRRRLGSARPEPVERAAWVAGMFMLFRAEAFRGVGGFDSRFRLYCEDFDICARLRLAGMDFTIAEDVEVQHRSQRASRHSLRPLIWHLSSLLKVWTSKVFWRYWCMLRSRRHAAE